MEGFVMQNNLINEMKITSALKNRRIYFSDEVNRDSIFEVVYFLDRIRDMDLKHNLPKEKIEIVINSYGGIIYDCNTLISKILSMIDEGYYIITTVSGVAMSAGFMISIVSSERRCYRYSTYLCHQPSFGTYGTLKDVQDEVEETKRLWNIMKKVILEHTKIKEEELDRMMDSKKDWIFSPEQALEYSIVDKIV